MDCYCHLGGRQGAVRFAEKKAREVMAKGGDASKVSLEPGPADLVPDATGQDGYAPLMDLDSVLAAEVPVVPKLSSTYTPSIDIDT